MSDIPELILRIWDFSSGSRIHLFLMDGMNTRTTFWQHLLKSSSTAKRSGPIAVLGACVLLGAGTPVVWAADTQSEEKYPDTALILDASGV